MRINTFNNVNKLTLKGKIIAFPTDTVYGIGALIDDEVAMKKIYNIFYIFIIWYIGRI